MAQAPLILGVGNPLFGDDGFGIEAVRREFKITNGCHARRPGNSPPSNGKAANRKCRSQGEFPIDISPRRHGPWLAGG